MPPTFGKDEIPLPALDSICREWSGFRCSTDSWLFQPRKWANIRRRSPHFGPLVVSLRATRRTTCPFASVPFTTGSSLICSRECRF
jgi:hypothetical protein